VQLPPELQMEIVEKAAAKYGNCQELAKTLEIPKSSVHYYRIGRLTMPASILARMLDIAGDEELRRKVDERGVTKDRTWANEYATSIYREICRDKLQLPTRKELGKDDELRRKAAAVISYVLAEGSIWLQKEKWGECMTNITFADHEADLYDHFRRLCKDVFWYDMGPPQKPGNDARAIRGFICSRFVSEWLIEQGMMPGDKSARDLRLPLWVRSSRDPVTWTAALQPWFDGEGSVTRHGSGLPVGYSIAQSRHTDIDAALVPIDLITAQDRSIGMAVASRTDVFGMQLRGFAAAVYRSMILDDVANLSSRLGLRPSRRLNRIHLKDDGFWSCIWVLNFSGADCGKIADLGLVTQQRKIGLLRSRTWPSRF